MGKNKRQKLAPNGKSLNNKSNKKAQKPPIKGSKPLGIAKPQQSAKKPKQPQHTTPTIPLSPDDRILLIGEGDLSFSRSLLEHHACTSIIATVYESAAELVEKYPQAAENAKVIAEWGGEVRYGFDAKRAGCWKDFRSKGRVHGVGNGSGEGRIDRVIFNFPHVGGKSTDVNRQVRYNQELLVQFFTHAIPILSPKTFGRTPSIIVTLFEGEPYTLWNIRDLARHSGLEVERSFKFQAAAYEGYRHARTLGVVKRKNGEDGGWRGEERRARSFVFVRRGEGESPGVGKAKKPNGKGESSDEDEGSGVEDNDFGGEGSINGDVGEVGDETGSEMWDGIQSDDEGQDD